MPPPSSNKQSNNAQRRSHLKVLILIGAILSVMTGLVAYSAPLYRLFCAATGYAGATQRVAADKADISSRMVTVRFTTDVAPGLPWRFASAQREVTLHLGQDTLAFFHATNLSDQDYVGHATFNVTPAKAGIYFKKIQCFCFSEERLGAHQSVDMPVDFFVDPRLGTDPNTQDVDTITLSYTFFASKRPEGAKDLARFVSAEPSAIDGQKIYVTRCAGCHGLDHAIVGPPLRGVFGRRAGSVASYPYSGVLKQSGITWNAASLDKWLVDPQQDVPGALMPFALGDKKARQDVIAYLEAESAAGKKIAASEVKPASGTAQN